MKNLGREGFNSPDRDLGCRIIGTLGSQGTETGGQMFKDLLINALSRNPPSCLGLVWFVQATTQKSPFNSGDELSWALGKQKIARETLKKSLKIVIIISFIIFIAINQFTYSQQWFRETKLRQEKKKKRKRKPFLRSTHAALARRS